MRRLCLLRRVTFVQAFREQHGAQGLGLFALVGPAIKNAWTCLDENILGITDLEIRFWRFL